MALEEAHTDPGDETFRDGRSSLLTVGKHLPAGLGREGEAILELISGGQWVIAPVHSGSWPSKSNSSPRRAWRGGGIRLAGSKPVVLDPFVSFGAPSIAGRGVKTANVHDLFVAEHRSLEAVRGWWDLTDMEIRVGGGVRGRSGGMKFFIDNNLSPGLAKGMKAFGEDVVHLTEVLPGRHATIRTGWLISVRRGGILVTRDDRIRYRPAESAALREHCVGAFFMGGKNLSRCQLIQQLVRNWPRMKELARQDQSAFRLSRPADGDEVQGRGAEVT